MKKSTQIVSQRTPRKLTLERTVVKHLSPQELATVAAGAPGSNGVISNSTGCRSTAGEP